MESSEGPRADGGAPSAEAASGVVVAPDVAPDVVPDAAATPAAPVAVDGPAYATWGQRVVAAILDDAVLAGVTWLALGSGFSPVTLTPVFGAAGTGSWGRGPLVLIPVAVLAALLVLQALTGWTPGKLVVGIRVVREGEHRPAGLWRTLARWVLHVLDAILLIGYLRPLWHAKRQTFADSVVRTVVVSEGLDLPRRPRTAVYVAAAVTCVLGLGYCVPISSSGGESLVAAGPCRLENVGPALTGGEITPAASVSTNQDRRLWTVRETRSVSPGAMIAWTVDPSARGTSYRVELDVRPGPGEEPVVSGSWDIGTGSAETWEDDAGFMHTRIVAAGEDWHNAEVRLTGPGSDLDVDAGRWFDVRLLADGAELAACGGAPTWTAP
ncbi:RDD family protein [Promicromonospora sp. NPDC059942]|uniref:RDD family protein n=1 Tax=Promicromonospora sp. NPDC059942 TaxID=3347009 RepID=UPI0036555F03